MNRRFLAVTAVLLATTTAAADELYPCRIAQPGAYLAFGDDRGAWCVLGFLFKGSDGHVYAATTQSCAARPSLVVDQGPIGVGTGRNDFVGERRWPYGKGRVAEVRPANDRLGTFVYQRVAAADTSVGIGLVRLDRGVRYDATVCGLAGPTRVQDSTAPTPQRVWHPPFPEAPAYDWTGVVVAPPGEALAPEGFADREVVLTTIAGNAAFKGVPVLAGDDAALGLWTGSSGVPPHQRNVERIGPAIARAERFLGVRLTLLRAGARGRAT